MLDPGLTGKHALVTGGNHGIGAATAEALAAQGVKIFIQYLRQPPPPGALLSDERLYHENRAATADDVVAAIQQEGGEAASLEIDLANPENIARLLDGAQAEFGPVDILVNNAAAAGPDTFVPRLTDLANPLPHLWTREPIPRIDPRTINQHFAVNTRAVALLMAEFARRLV